MRIIVRSAYPDDAEAVATMASALSAHDGYGPGAFDAAAFRRDGFGRAAAFSVLVAGVGGAVVGYAMTYPGYGSISASRGLHLADLFVDPGARGRGVGRALVAAVARSCRDGGGDWVSWTVLAGNTRSRAFYERIGATVDAPELACYSLEGPALAALAG